MVELADAPDSKSGGSNTVWVQVPLSAPMTYLFELLVHPDMKPIREIWLIFYL